MNKKPIQLEETWLKILENEFEKPYFSQLRGFLKEEKNKGKTIYPPGKLIFNALNSTNFPNTKVVIIGQDPYHGRGQAHGLSFSVPQGIKPPPSLVNIFKELQMSTNFEIPNHGNLEAWAKQGVLLLNAILTVEAGKAASHHKRGWEEFTDAIIYKLNEQKSNLVFMLWGKYAQQKGAFINRDKHLVLQAPHPSPFSANRGFFGCEHFSLCNEYLKKHDLKEINWQL